MSHVDDIIQNADALFCSVFTLVRVGFYVTVCYVMSGRGILCIVSRPMKRYAMLCCRPIKCHAVLRYVILRYNNNGLWWGVVAQFGELRQERRRFESHTSRHVGTLSKSSTRRCLLRFGVSTLTQYQCCRRSASE